MKNLEVCTKHKSRQMLLFVQSEKNNVQHFQHENLNIHICIQHYDIISHHCTDNKKKASTESPKFRYLKRRIKPELFVASKLIHRSSP